MGAVSCRARRHSVYATAEDDVELDHFAKRVLEPLDPLALLHSPFLGTAFVQCVAAADNPQSMHQLQLLLEMRVYSTLLVNGGAPADQLLNLAQRIADKLHADSLLRSTALSSAADNALSVELEGAAHRLPAGLGRRQRRLSAGSSASPSPEAQTVSLARHAVAHATEPVPGIFADAEVLLVAALQPFVGRLLNQSNVTNTPALHQLMGSFVAFTLSAERRRKDTIAEKRGAGDVTPTSPLAFRPKHVMTTAPAAVAHLSRVAHVPLSDVGSVMHVVSASSDVFLGEDNTLRVAKHVPPPIVDPDAPTDDESGDLDTPGSPSSLTVRPLAASARLLSSEARALMVTERGSARLAMKNVESMLRLSPVLPRLTPLSTTQHEEFARFTLSVKAAFCDENLMFWEQAMLYKALASTPFAPKRALAQLRTLIVNEYVRADAPSAINIESALAAKIVKKLSAPAAADDFDEPLKVVAYLLREPFKRFQDNLSDQVVASELSAVRDRIAELSVRVRNRVVDGSRRKVFSAGNLMSALVRAGEAESVLDAAALCQRLTRAGYLKRAEPPRSRQRSCETSERSARSTLSMDSVNSSHSDGEGAAASWLRNKRTTYYLADGNTLVDQRIAKIKPYVRPMLLSRVTDEGILWGCLGPLAHLVP